MKAKLIKIKEYPSRYGGQVFYAFFKDTNEKSYKTCLHNKCANFRRWLPVLQEFSPNKELWLDNLVLKGKNLIDADSLFIEIKQSPNQN